MSNFDNFDINQISSKFAQRWPFVCNFYCKNFFILGSFDDTENAKRQFFLGHPIPSHKASQDIHCLGSNKVSKTPTNRLKH